MTLNEYSHAALSTSKVEGSKVDRLNYINIALAGEVGEYCNIYKKFLRTHEDLPTLEMKLAMLDELGDVLWYLNSAIKELGSSLNEVAQDNLDKLADRYKEAK